MSAPVFACTQHGVHEGTLCPACERRGRRVLDEERRQQLSKFCSGVLRHFPDDVGIDLDPGGWTDVDDLAAVVADRYEWAGERELVAVVATDQKRRFERSGDRIRAAYGHSVDVNLDVGPEREGPDVDAVPGTLYHGTDPAKLPSILDDGLEPMGRQHVHLSGSVADAREVGRRHAEPPAVLVVDAGQMQSDSHRIRRRGPTVYVTDHVPPTYLSVYDAPTVEE